MKLLSVILTALVVTFIANAEGSPIELKGIDEGRRDYGPQLVERFWEMIESSEELSAKFDSFSQQARERSGGRYLGPEIQPLVLNRSEEVDFRDTGGWRRYAQTVALYCSFAEGFRKGMQIETGVFAVFEVRGEQAYRHLEGDTFETKAHRVEATFKGFRVALEAGHTGAEQPASSQESR